MMSVHILLDTLYKVVRKPNPTERIRTHAKESTNTKAQ